MTVIASPLVLIADQFDVVVNTNGTMTMDFDNGFVVSGGITSVQRYGNRRNPKSVLAMMSDGSSITATRGENPNQIHYTVIKSDGEVFQKVMVVTTLSKTEPDGVRTEYSIFDVAGLIGVGVAIVGIAVLTFLMTG